MKVLQRFSRVSILFAALAAVAGGCVDNDISLTITKFIPPMTSTVCSFSPAGDIHIERGTWDVLLAKYTLSGYDANFVVSNNLPTLSNVPIQTQVYFVSDYDIVLEPEGALAAAIPASRREFSYHAATIRLEPGATAAAGVEAIPADLAPQLAAVGDLSGVVVAKIRAVATRAEMQVTSAYASFPIQICKGCLANTDSTGNLPPCPLPKGTVPVLDGDPCNVAQDAPGTCCAISDQSAVCGMGAIATM